MSTGFVEILEHLTEKGPQDFHKLVRRLVRMGMRPRAARRRLLSMCAHRYVTITVDVTAKGRRNA
jgi:hypothetical protein